VLIFFYLSLSLHQRLHFVSIRRSVCLSLIFSLTAAQSMPQTSASSELSSYVSSSERFRPLTSFTNFCEDLYDVAETKLFFYEIPTQQEHESKKYRNIIWSPCSLLELYSFILYSTLSLSLSSLSFSLSLSLYALVVGPREDYKQIKEVQTKQK
jgi:hypothetical protein